MTNRISEIRIVDHLHDPTQPEIWIDVVPETESATLEVHGRLMGPRCLYASTVEVAYPLRPFGRLPDGWSPLARRVIVPEASLWEPESPFLYQGPVELWQDGACCDRISISRGLRRLQLGPDGVLLNGRAFNIRGASTFPETESEARELRQRGINTLLAPVGEKAAKQWDAADRWGFFLIGQLDGSEASFRQVTTLKTHACCLAWVL